MKESEENARQLFHMEEIYHLGKFDQYTDEQRILRAEKQLHKKLDEEKGKQSKILSIHRWMKYAAVIAVMLVMGGGSRILVLSKRKQSTNDGCSSQRRHC